jgi:hypothetical protein
MRAWLRLLEDEIAFARDQGELHPNLNPADTAFAVNALAIAANILFQLHNDRRAFHRARRTIEELLSRPVSQ